VVEVAAAATRVAREPLSARVDMIMNRKNVGVPSISPLSKKLRMIWKSSIPVISIR